jgi:putative glutathione S-transferase
MIENMAQFPKEQSQEGVFQRQEDAFRDWVLDQPEASYLPAIGRYHLYVSYACPWAHRTILVRKIKGLEKVIGMSVVDPIRSDEEGWAFRTGAHMTGDLAGNFSFLKEAYLKSDPDYEGRVTVPVLWDTETKRIVSNSDDEIMRMLNSEFDRFAEFPQIDLYPESLRSEIDKWNERIHHDINDGVYRAGFATTQKAYEDAVLPLFDTLDQLENRLHSRKYFHGEQTTETDWRLYVTLARFDAVYYTHFKCNIRRIVDYPRLHDYLVRLHYLPGVSNTLNMDHIKRHYYYTHDDLNPHRIVPVGPESPLGL